MKYVMTVEGMSCMHCAGRVEKALAALGANAKVDLESKSVEIDAPASVSEKAMLEAVEAAGYEPKDIKAI